MDEDSLEGVVDASVFEDLQNKLDEDAKVKDEIREAVQELEKRVKLVLTRLQNVHYSNDMESARAQIEETSMSSLIKQLQVLAIVASPHPYYKFNAMWSRQVQDCIFAVLLNHWIKHEGTKDHREYVNFSPEDVARVLEVHYKPEDEDTFQITTEEFLQGLISLIDELARLTRTWVTLGDYSRPRVIKDKVKELHDLFGLLNLKNDNLRKRVDSIKYKLRECEDVVYDLSLRGL